MESLDLLCVEMMNKDKTLQRKLADNYRCCKQGEKASTLNLNLYLGSAIRRLVSHTVQAETQQGQVIQLMTQPKPSPCHSNLNNDIILEDRHHNEL